MSLSKVTSGRLDQTLSAGGALCIGLQWNGISLCSVTQNVSQPDKSLSISAIPEGGVAQLPGGGGGGTEGGTGAGGGGGLGGPPVVS